MTHAPQTHYDAVIIGGSFSGTAAALLLRRQRPQARIVVVEQSEHFGRRVGEATVEVSGYFLHQVLGLSDYLEREHLEKHGLRFWLTDGQSRALEDMTEIGADEAPRLASFQLDRAKLDEYLLHLADLEGCEVLRPARVLAVDTVDTDSGSSQVRIESADGEHTLHTRWVLDASGRHAFLARRKRLLQRLEAHPTAALWGRWSGVQDLDGPTYTEATADAPPRLPAVDTQRRLATNHFCGYGWWCWVIPLSGGGTAGGDTSIGLVYHKDLFELPGKGSKLERFRDFVTSQDGLRDLLASAQLDENDFQSYNHLPYQSSRYMERGWALLGDAAGFLDPLYSPGLDHASISVYATVQLLVRDLDPAQTLSDADIETHNKAFADSYPRWWGALYDGKYEILGDADLVAAAYTLDTALYYLGVVGPVYRDLTSLRNPPFGLDAPQSVIAYKIMRAWNQRLRRLARLRRYTGLYGRRNFGTRIYGKAFGLAPRDALRSLCRGLGLWLRLEARQLWACLRYGRPALRQPVADAPAVEAAVAPP